MARPSHLFVICYDISRDSTRGRVADFLATRLVRVQKSVFEGRMSKEDAASLATKAKALLDLDDSLRIYCVTEGGRRNSQAIGPMPLPEAQEFWLL